MKAKTNPRRLTMVKLYTVDDVADMLKISVSSVYKLAERGEITSIKIRTSLRFTENHINAYIKKRERWGNYGRK